MYMDTSNCLPPAFVKQLKQIVNNNDVLVDPADCWPYGYDNSCQHVLPQVVVFATLHSQVTAIVALCYQYVIPLVVRGRGTGTTGATVPHNRGLVLSLERMNQITSIDAGNRVIQCEPGVTNEAVQKAAAEYGFFWPPDPTSAPFCSIGGNLGFNSAGPRAVKYGTTRENTLGLKAVIGTGEEIHTGVYTTKGVVGYDLTRLLIGSEGTLAIITEATLKLIPKAQTLRTIQAVYSSMTGAARAVTQIMTQPVIPYALEFIDGSAIAMVRSYSGHDLPTDAGAMLMIEADGSDNAIEDAVLAIMTAAKDRDLLTIRCAHDEADVERLWKTRKALSPALRTIAPKKINEDIVVPITSMPDLIAGLEKISQQSGIPIVNFGHAGNGNIHVNLLIKSEDDAELERASNCLKDVFSLVLSLKGTISGEHGIGLVKRDFIAGEIDPVSLRLMRAIKAQFDPAGILNPGKIFPV